MRPSLFSMMRRILPLIAAVALLPGKMLGADQFPPLKMSYQANIVDANGTPIGNTAPENHTIDFTIYDQSNVGAAVYHETQLVTIDKGAFSVLLGDGTVDNTKTYKNLGAVFASPNASDRYVEVTVTLANNVQTTLAPRVRLVSSPYSFLSSQANNSYQAVYSDVAGSLTNNGSGTTFTTALVARLDAAQSFSGICTFNQSVTFAAGGRLNDQPLYLRGGSDIAHGLSYGSAWGIDGAALFGYNGGVLGGMSSGNKRVALSWTGDGKVGINKTGANDTLDVNGGVTATTFTGNGVIPVGGIIMWSGAVNQIPSGWALCNGGNGTPNLQNRFIIGAGNLYNPNNTGGAKEVTLSAGNLPPHTHNYRDSYFSENNGLNYGYAGSNKTDNDNNPFDYYINRTTDGGNSLNSTPFSILPPYYALAFIMRVQ